MNTPTIPDWLRPIFGRAVASVLAAGLGYLTRKGIDLGLSDAEQAQFTEGITAVTWAVMLAVYAAAHRLISIKTNPTDSAAPSMATAATGPLGAGEREALGARLEAAAKSGAEEVVAREQERERVAEIVRPPAPPKNPAKKRAPRKRKVATDDDVVKLRRSSDVDPSTISGDPHGFGDYQPTARDLPRSISPRPKLSNDDSGII